MEGAGFGVNRFGMAQSARRVSILLHEHLCGPMVWMPISGKFSAEGQLQRDDKARAPHAPRSGSVYFDITDVVHFAMRENRVSGIQRVQTRIVNHYAGLRPKHTFALFQHPGSGQIVVTEAAGLFDDQEFDPLTVLAKLGLAQWRRFPKKRKIVARIGLKNPPRWRVLVEQAKIYTQTLMAPSRLRQAGLFDSPLAHKVRPVRLHAIAGGLAPASLVFLGTNWSFEHLHSFAEQTRQHGGRVFQLIHDLIPIHFEEYCSPNTRLTFSQFITGSCAFVTNYLAVSECTRNDLVTFLQDAGINVPVAVLPLAHEFGGYPREKLPSCDTGNYFLFVGTLDRRKNIEGILGAWRMLSEQMGAEAPRLVFAGRPGWDSADFMAALDADPKLCALIDIEDSPSDARLAHLYAGCRCLLLPSHAEGWGLPIGEAAWFGRASMVTRCTSLPEVCPESTIFVEGFSAQHIADAVRAVCLNPALIRAKEEALRAIPLRVWKDVARRLDVIVSEVDALRQTA